MKVDLENSILALGLKSRRELRASSGSRCSRVVRALNLAQQVLIGVDGCRSGWLAVVEQRGQLTAQIFPGFQSLVEAFPAALIGIDIPIGLPDSGRRACDARARAFLGRLRSSSVFSAPVRGCLVHEDYSGTCARHRAIDGRGLSKQTFYLLPKIREVDEVLRRERGRLQLTREVHPEVSFALWNGGAAMAFKKSRPEGRREREVLIESVWPAQRTRLARELQGGGFAPDDLNDAFAVLWSTRRIASGIAKRLPEVEACDSAGIPMTIWA